MSLPVAAAAAAAAAASTAIRTAAAAASTAAVILTLPGGGRVWAAVSLAAAIVSAVYIPQHWCGLCCAAHAR